MVSSFKSCLKETIRETALEQWSSPLWKSSWPMITQAVLIDAYEKHDTVRSIFAGMEMQARPCKSLARVEKKQTEQPAGRENYFKVVSDFCAVRIHCNVTEIPAKVDRIRDIVLSQGGQVYVRGSATDKPYGCKQKETFTDITQYVYVFLEKVGYIVEMQIGHPFASHTFTIDSAIRDNPTCGKVDLWKDDFYDDVKKFILAKANNVEGPALEAIQAKAASLHDNNVPDELQRILGAL